LVVHHQDGGRTGLRIGLGHGANVCALHNPSKPSYLRTRMMSGAASPSPSRSTSSASLTAVRGLSVGHWTDLARATGCTVVLAPEGGMRGACALRGSASGTRALDELYLRHMVGKIDELIVD